MSTSKIKTLRQQTGAGILDCKKALEETGGDIAKAVAILREKGLAAAAKKAGRKTAEGLVDAYINDEGRTGVLLEVNCETDFVAKTEEFHAFVHSLAQHIVKSSPANVSALEQQPLASNPAVTVGEFLKENIAKFGENISIHRFERIDHNENGMIESYIHGHGKIGVLVAINSETAIADGDFPAFCHDLAMHVAAANPLCVAKADLDAAIVEQERNILLKQAINDGKPPEIAEKVVRGRLAKFIREVCLLEQPFVKDQDLSVGELLKQKSEQYGQSITLSRFVRFERGQGLEKKEEDFAAEVVKLQQS